MDPFPKEDKSRFVLKGFNGIAGRYDRLNDAMTLGLHRMWKRAAARLLNAAPGGRVLDLCSGTGDLARRAAALVGRDGFVAALDFSPGMMQAGRGRTVAGEAAPVAWIQGDACELPFADHSFGGALVGFGLRNVTSIERALDETLRVLKPGARLVNLDTAGAEWRIFEPALRFHMNAVVPRLGRWLAGSEGMYQYLSDSAGAFHPPDRLEAVFAGRGFVNTGHRHCPRAVGGAALVWGEKPF